MLQETHEPAPDLAEHHRRLFHGDAVTATSPQGSCAELAEQLDGRAVQDVCGFGNHIVYDFGDGLYLHVRLGPRSRFSERAAEEPPEPAARLRLEGSRAIVELVEPIACDVVDAEERARIVRGYH
jgi:endonuclease VIII